MIHFLVTIDSAGAVRHIKWSNPVYLISSHAQSILELFPAEQHEAMKQLFETCIREKHPFPFEKSIPLADSGEQIKLCFLALESTILVYGEQIISLQDGKPQEPSDSTHRFMKVIKEYARQIEDQKTESTRMQFEQIQALNNELINTKRMVEKANAQLSVMNEEMNNRLVKDALTGLVSRYQYREEIQLRLNEHPGKLGVFMFIDIDSFKSINDTHGHGVGDEYLVAFSRRLQKLPFDNDVKMRIAGDEFGIFTCGFEQVDETEMAQMWQLIQKRVLNRPIRTSAGQLPISISVGMAVYGQDTDNIFELIDYADFAMYRAKRKGKNQFDYFRRDEYLRARKSN